MLRVIREIMPSWVLAENVPGLLSLTSGLLFDHMLDDLEASGFEIGPPLLIPASGVGANHRRERIFIVARNTNGRDGNKREKRKVGQGQDPESTRVYQDVADTGRSGRIQPQEGRREAGERDRNGGQDVADTKSLRGLEIQRDEPDGVLSADVPDTAAARWRSQGSAKEMLREPKTVERLTGCDWWAVEPGMGNLADGFSAWLAEPDIPRVAKGVKDRVNKLRALGNAVVPQQIYPILRAIAEVEREFI